MVVMKCNDWLSPWQVIQSTWVTEWAPHLQSDKSLSLCLYESPLEVTGKETNVKTLLPLFGLSLSVFGAKKIAYPCLFHTHIRKAAHACVCVGVCVCVCVCVSACSWGPRVSSFVFSTLSQFLWNEWPDIWTGTGVDLVWSWRSLVSLHTFLRIAFSKENGMPKFTRLMQYCNNQSRRCTVLVVRESNS